MDDLHNGGTPGPVAPQRLQEHPSFDVLSPGAAAADAGLSPPHTDDDPRLAGAGVVRDQDKADTTIVTDLDGQRKAFVTLRARFAMAGYALLELSDGSLLATRWNLCRPLPDATAALRFLRQIGGAA